MELDVPISVSPGTIILRGAVSVQIPDSLRVLIRYWKEIDAISDNLSFRVAMGGNAVAVRVSRFQTGVVSAKTDPLVANGTITTQAVEVPAGTTGNVSVDLPCNGMAVSPIDQSHAAFTLQLRATGGPLIGRDVRSYMACSAPDSAKLAIASIPIRAPESPRSG